MKEKDLAKEWIYGNEVVGVGGKAYKVPTCPSCGEPTYSESRCLFCNQLIKEVKQRGD